MSKDGNYFIPEKIEQFDTGWVESRGTFQLFTRGGGGESMDYFWGNNFERLELLIR